VVEGFCLVDVAPLPKSHCQEVAPPVDRSVKFTIMGEHPEVISALKSAAGVWAKLSTGRSPQKTSKVAMYFKTVKGLGSSVYKDLISDPRLKQKLNLF
jgi:hypothetical protein